MNYIHPMNITNLVLSNQPPINPEPLLPPPVNTIIRNDWDKYRPDDDEKCCDYDCCDIILCSCIFRYFF